MLFRLMPPRSDLMPYIAYIWEVRGVPILPYEQIVPSGFVELMFNLGSELFVVDPKTQDILSSWTGVFINGLNSKSIFLKMGAELHLVGVRLKPEGAFALLGHPMHELSNQVIAADALLANLNFLVEQLLYLPDYQARKISLEIALLKLAKPYTGFLKIQAALDYLHQVEYLSDKRLGDIAENVCLNPKNMWRMFEQYVGLSPQKMKKIIRVNRALQLLHTPVRRSLTEIAYQSAYADQSHLIREFKQLTGLSPKKYLAFKSPNLGHLYF